MKYVFQLSILLVSLLFLSLPVCASGEVEDFLDETLDQFGESLEESIPEEADSFMESLNLRDLDWRQVLSLQPDQFLTLIRELLEQQWKEPIRLLGQILGILLLSSLLFPLQDSLLKDNASLLFSFAAVICLCASFAGPVADCISAAMESIQHCSVFLLSLIPVLCGILTAGGQAAAATGYQLLLFTICQIVSQLAVSTMVPLMGMYFALSMISGVFPKLGMQGIISGIKSAACWGLGIVTTIFVGLLSLQTFVSANVDVVTMKTSRFLMGSFIPVVGSILSEAYGAAQGCMALLKSTIGTFGIVVALCTILPVLLRVVLWYLITWLAEQFCSMMQVGELGEILKGAANTFAILLALMLCFLLLMVVATSLVIFIGTGG